ncbi:O-antigen ligase [Halomonas sp. KM-1]|uniref:O-antigen ligase family protein n=1 Tax=Halomonas sp. KM-1 TaxID=590061 RepID=UPI00130D887C|nr:O-antigen ligase family protein [Halomonas sp. KM-1]
MTLKSMLWLVVLATSALGSMPTLSKFGGVSLSGVITAGVALSALIVFLLKPMLYKNSIKAILAVLAFWILSLGSYFGFYPEVQKGIQNYPIVWGGMLFLLLSFSNSYFSHNSVASISKLLIRLCGWLYCITLLFMYFHEGVDPAGALAGIFFFCFALSELYHGKQGSIFLIVCILVVQILMGARIVIIAEVFIFFFGNILLYGLKERPYDFMRKSSSKVLSIMAVLVGVFVIMHTGFLDKSIAGGDQALVIGGVQFNTSGRMYMWGVVLDSALASPWLGHGTPGPAIMLETPRWSHPHNDYLRIFHQFGVLGLIIWSVFIWQGLKHSRFAAKFSPVPEGRLLSKAAYFSLIGLSLAMITDNPIVYSYVVYPIFALLGVAFSYSANCK